MRLMDCELRPGVVLAVCNNYGTVKASCCGLFSEDDDVDLLPPVYPLIKTSNTSYCEPQIGDLVWVWINHSNPLELFYTFMGDVVANNQGILDQGGYDACNIISKDNDHDASLLWSDQDGWKMNQGESVVQIAPSGEINVSDGQRSIQITESGIDMSTGGESNPAVLGNELKSTLQELINLLQKTATIAKTNPQTMTLGVTLESGLIEVTNKLSKILSENISLD